MADKDKTTPDDGGAEKPAEESKAGNPTPKLNGTTAKPTTINLSSLRHEVTQEEKAEENRRRKAIQAGLHPDTGKRLRPGDEKTLKATEQMSVRISGMVAPVFQVLPQAHTTLASENHFGCNFSFIVSS